MNPLGQPVQADVRGLAQPRESKERSSLLVRIYNLEYIAIPALQRDYQQHLEQRRDSQSMDPALRDSQQAIQLAQDSLVELKTELLNLEALYGAGLGPVFMQVSRRRR